MLKIKRTFDLVNDLFGFENPDIEKLMRKIRELLVLRNIPIKYYAISKQDIVSTFFEYLSNTVDSGVVYSSFIRIVNKVDEVVRALRKKKCANKIDWFQSVCIGRYPL